MKILYALRVPPYRSVRTEYANGCLFVRTVFAWSCDKGKRQERK